VRSFRYRIAVTSAYACSAFAEKAGLGFLQHLLRLVAARGGLPQPRRRAVHARGEFELLDGDEELTRLHPIPLPDADLPDVAHDLAGDKGLGPGADSPDRFLRGREPNSPQGFHADSADDRRLDPGGLRRSFAVAAGKHQDPDGHDGQPEPDQAVLPPTLVDRDCPTPSFLRMSSMRQKRVRADWNRFNPTNRVNSSQYGLWT
jgi:hypothetical protein